MQENEVIRSASGLLGVMAAGFPLAFELKDIVGLAPLGAGAGEGGSWIQGTVRFRRREIPLVSLAAKLGAEGEAEGGQAAVIDFAGAWIAVRIDSVIEMNDSGSRATLPLPPGLSELPEGLFKGWIDFGEFGAMAVNLEALFDDAEHEELGQAMAGQEGIPA